MEINLFSKVLSSLYGKLKKLVSYGKMFGKASGKLTSHFRTKNLRSSSKKKVFFIEKKIDSREFFPPWDLFFFFIHRRWWRRSLKSISRQKWNWWKIKNCWALWKLLFSRLFRFGSFFFGFNFFDYFLVLIKR